MEFVERSSHIIHHILDGEFSYSQVNAMVTKAFNFPLPIKKINKNISCLELFHGKTLAFKDFGARFMAQCIAAFGDSDSKPVTILTATSGDTGAAVAHAFYKIAGIRVKILYPKGKYRTYKKSCFVP